MAIIISTSKEYPYTLMGLFGVSKELMDKAKAVGLSITQPLANSFTFKLNDHAYGTVPVKSQVITLVKKGELGTMSKGSYKGQFGTAIPCLSAPGGTAIRVPTATRPQDQKSWPRVSLRANGDWSLCLLKGRDSVATAHFWNILWRCLPCHCPR